MHRKVLVVTLISVSACGGGADQASNASCAPTGTAIRISADNFNFDTDCLTAPAGEQLTVEFRNDDWEVHNFTLLLDPDENLLASHEPYAVTAPSDETVTESWPALEAGTYEFVCTLHPAMSGTFNVA